MEQRPEKENIFDEIVKHTGLKKEVILRELEEYLQHTNKRIEDLTLAEIRPILSQYVRKTILEVFEDTPTPPEEDSH